jgi:hypothetical protein
MPISHKLTEAEIDYINEEMSKPSTGVRGAGTAQVLADMFNVQRGAIYYQFNKFRGNKYNYAKTPAPAITTAPEAVKRTIKATLGVAVDAFRTTMPTGTLDSPEATGDSLAEVLFMQTEIVGWAKANEDEQLLLRELASKIDTLIIDLEQTQAMHKLASEHQSVSHQLKGALAQVERLQAIIDTEREHKRRSDNPSTYGK